VSFCASVCSFRSSYYRMSRAKMSASSAPPSRLTMRRLELVVPLTDMLTKWTVLTQLSMSWRRCSMTALHHHHHQLAGLLLLLIVSVLRYPDLLDNCTTSGLHDMYIIGQRDCVLINHVSCAFSVYCFKCILHSCNSYLVLS